LLNILVESLCILVVNTLLNILVEYPQRLISINPRAGFPTCGTRRSSRWYARNFYFFTKTWIHSFL